MEYLRGSEWRRWDFHLHTPFTKKNDLYSGNGDEKWAQFYADVISYIGDGSDPQRKIAAVGITDYFSEPADRLRNCRIYEKISRH